MMVEPWAVRSVTAMVTGAEGGAANADWGGAIATMVLAVQLETMAGTPLIVTELPGRKPMPVMVI